MRATRATVADFAARHGLSGPGVVAVSGGADSVGLLAGLHAAGFGPLTAAHLHHGIRGADADADAELVRRFAAHLGLPCEVGYADVPALGGNREAAGRAARYSWLGGVALTRGAAWVATGHTADDQAETVLDRVLRGTGLRGLRGIVPARPLVPGVRLVRPLLTLGRAELRAEVEAAGLPFADDATNADPAFTRARIRRDLLPLLRTFHPNAVAHLAALAGQAAEAHDRLDALAAAALADCELPRLPTGVRLDRRKLAPLGPAAVRDVLRHVWRREGWSENRADAATWERAARLVLTPPGRVELPGGVRLRSRSREVELTRAGGVSGQG